MVKLRKGDCLARLKEVKDKSVDCVIMDPPYFQTGSAGSGCFGGANRDYYERLSCISSGFDIKILDELRRVMKKVNLYTFCNKKQLSWYLQYFQGCNFDLLSWHKSNPIPATSNIYLRDTEYCLFFREKGVRLYGNYNTKHTYYIASSIRQPEIHPTIKPIEWIKMFVENSTQVGDVILDPFMGSGTTGMAAVSMDRSFIGIEIDDTYYRTAKKRIKGCMLQ